MKRFFALCAAALLVLGACHANAERAAIPDMLRFTQETMARDYVRDKQYILRTYPQTANENVNADLRALIDSMMEKARPNLPEGKVDPISYLDVGATIFRTGSQWMSFLTIAHIAYNKEQTYVDFDARVYDMVSGSRLSLKDLFAPESAAWDLIAQEVRTQLTDYFMTESPDAAALEALCTREALESAAFTLTPAKLELHYRADTLYPGKNTLMHVKLYYSALRPLMTDRGQKITDNSRYKMIALTYDDGGARGSTNSLLRCLQKYGANATFFIVGTMMNNNHDIMCRQQDAGYAMASHNYVHTYTGINAESVSRWKKKFDTEMDAIVGVRPAYMRAPGGHSTQFTKSEAGLPVIHWSLSSSDADNGNVDQVAGRVIYGARDGDVVLMHDLNPLSPDYSEMILKELENRNFLCVTVDELFDHYGVPLEPNTVYWGCVDEAASQ
ncbi:MAG: polysaccharide deacetylase family protein [Clostridia bacterium]|nr:polysaccharide deacetylase family protein [Clostridia bacterium]